jgi:hypothetical protein
MAASCYFWRAMLFTSQYPLLHELLRCMVELGTSDASAAEAKKLAQTTINHFVMEAISAILEVPCCAS